MGDTPKVIFQKGLLRQIMGDYAAVNCEPIVKSGAYREPENYTLNLPAVTAEGGIKGRIEGQIIKPDMESLARDYGMLSNSIGLDEEEEDIEKRAPKPKKREHVWDEEEAADAYIK